MIKKVTAVTIWNDAVGMRMSISYSEIDKETGTVVSDNKRIDRVIVDSAEIEKFNAAIFGKAQEFVSAL